MRLAYGVSLLLIAALSLSACDRKGGRTSGSTESSSAGASPDAEAGKKLGLYIKGYNDLLGDEVNLKTAYEDYRDKHIAERSAKGSDEISIVSKPWIDDAAESFKKAQAMPAKLDDLDPVADKFGPVLDRLATRLRALEIYYSSKAYLEDGLARGKREDPQVQADYRTLIDTMPDLTAAIDKEQDKRHQRLLDAMKAHGDMIGYDAELAMQRSKALLRLFRQAGDLRDPAKIKQADAYAAEIEQALADERQRLADAKAHPNPDGTVSMRDSLNSGAASDLESMIGDYREMKHTGSASAHRSMVQDFNRAVESNNLGG